MIEKLNVFLLVLCSCAALTGCASKGGVLGVDCCSDIPAGAVPEPPGTKICNFQQAQVAAASLDQNVLYQADFVDETTELAPFAQARLARRNAAGDLITALLIEPSGDRDLDQRRVEAVGNRLAESGVGNVPVELASPPALRLSGTEAEGSLSVGRANRGVRGGGGGIRSGRGGLGFGGVNVFGGGF